MSYIGIGPPGNVTIEGPMEVIEGHPFSLTCSATGFPLPDITYVKCPTKINVASLSKVLGGLQ